MPELQLMSYEDAVEQAAGALKRGEDANWELARLTWENTVAGGGPARDGKVTMEQWCADVRQRSGRRFSRASGLIYKAIWERHRTDYLGSQLSFHEAYQEVHGTTAQAETDRRNAYHIIEKAAPDTKQRVYQELSRDPDVVTPEARAQFVTEALQDPALQELPEVRSAVAGYSIRRSAHEEQRTEQKVTADPISREIQSREAILNLGAALDRFSREATESLRHAGELPPEEKWHNLIPSYNRAKEVMESVQRYIEVGRSDLDEWFANLLKEERR